MPRWARHTAWSKDYCRASRRPDRGGRHVPTRSLHRLSLECLSINFFVRITKPKIWVHSDTMLPTTCPHFELGSARANAQTHAAPVMIRKILSECSCNISQTGAMKRCGGLRLSADPLSYMNLVARTVTTTPLQSAMALPKNDPQCVFGSEWMYSTIQQSKMIDDTMLSECRRKNEPCFCTGIR